MRELSLKAGITMLYFGPDLFLELSVTFPSSPSTSRRYQAGNFGINSGHNNPTGVKLAGSILAMRLEQSRPRMYFRQAIEGKRFKSAVDLIFSRQEGRNPVML
jgi:hypothetical protein